MAGKNAKRRAKAAKAGIRSLELPKEMWQVLADVTSNADTYGATPPLVEKCRALAARARYYHGEPENKNGLVRGELPRVEWEAYCELVEKLGDTSPDISALAHTMEVLLDTQGLSVHTFVGIDDQDEQAQRDASTICQPIVLHTIIALLGMSVEFSERANTRNPMSAEEEADFAKQSGISSEKARKSMRDGVESAREKLYGILHSVQDATAPTRIVFPLTGTEARAVYCSLQALQETVHIKKNATPEIKRLGEEVDDILKTAIRFFERMASPGADVLKELQ